MSFVLSEEGIVLNYRCLGNVTAPNGNKFMIIGFFGNIDDSNKESTNVIALINFFLL